MGDIYVKLVLIVLIGGIALWALSGFFAKNPRGAWDERTKIAGLARSRRWNYREYIENAQKFLLPEATKLRHWPVLENAAGYDGIKNFRSSSWRSIFVRTPANPHNLVFSYEIPITPAGAQFQFPEALFHFPTSAPTSAASFPAAQWDITGDRELTAAICASAAGEFFTELAKIEYVHIYRNYISFLLPEQKFNRSSLELLDWCAQRAGKLAQLLPKSYLD